MRLLREPQKERCKGLAGPSCILDLCRDHLTTSESRYVGGGSGGCNAKVGDDMRRSPMEKSVKACSLEREIAFLSDRNKRGVKDGHILWKKNVKIFPDALFERVIGSAFSVSYRELLLSPFDGGVNGNG